MSSRASPALIGGFVVSGIVLAVAGVIILGSGRVFDETREFVSFFPGSVNGLQPGANVAFRGVTIGRVTDIRLALDFEVEDFTADMRIPVVYEIDQTRLEQMGVEGDLSSNAGLLLSIERGITARLDTESLVTGRLYVSLDLRPDADILVHGEDVGYPEIPTVRSPMAEVQAQLHEIADKFVSMDVDEIVTSLRATLDGINGLMTNESFQGLPDDVSTMVRDLDATANEVRTLVASLESTLEPLEARIETTAASAEESMDEVEETMASLRAVTDPDAPLVVGLVGTLQELESAARSLRRVTELLERDPSVLVRGRRTGGGS